MAITDCRLVRNEDRSYIPLSGTVRVGRATHNGVVLKDKHSSREHATLHVARDGAWVVDLGSKGGTFVNGARLDAHQRRRLNPRDLVRFTDEEFQFIATLTPADAETAIHTVSLRPAQWSANPRAIVDGLTRFVHRTRRIVWSKDKWSGDPPVTITKPILWVDAAKRIVALTARPDGGEQRWTIGSDPACDILFDVEGVSRHHATLKCRTSGREKERWMIVNEMATYGTYVNGMQVRERFLESRDRLVFGGNAECILFLPEAAQIGAAIDGVRAPKAVRLAVAAMILMLVLIVSSVGYLRFHP